MLDVDSSYGAADIKVLEGLTAVRMRPAMYIGNTSVEGLHHLVYEVVDNSVDEAMAGFCDLIDVKILNDDSVIVMDNGRLIESGNHYELILAEGHYAKLYKRYQLEQQVTAVT